MHANNGIIIAIIEPFTYGATYGAHMRKYVKSGHFLAKQSGGIIAFFALCSLVARLGFEPRQTESESVVLPLHNRAKQI